MAPTSEAGTGDQLVRELVWPVADGEAVHVTWDVTNNSVRLRHRRGDLVLTDLHREMATLLTVTGVGETAEILLEYGPAGCSGRARVRLSPEVRIQDDLLRS